MDRPVHDVHDRLRRERRLQRVSVRAADQPALQDRPSRDADQPRRDAEVPAAAGAAAGRADRRQRLHPALFPRQAGEGQRHDRGAGRRRRRRELPRLLVVRALPPARRSGVSAGAPAPAVVAPRSRRRSASRARRCRARRSKCSSARAAARNCSGAARPAGGATEARAADARSARRSSRRSTVPVEGLRARQPPLARQPRRRPRVRRPARRPARRAVAAAEDSVPRDEAAPLRAPADARRQADDGAFDRGARAVSRSRRRRLRDAAAAVLQAVATAIGKKSAEEGGRALSRPRHDLPAEAGLRRADGGVVPRRRLRRALPGGVRALGAAHGRLHRRRLLHDAAEGSDRRPAERQLPACGR